MDMLPRMEQVPEQAETLKALTGALPAWPGWLAFACGNGLPAVFRAAVSHPCTLPRLPHIPRLPPTTTPPPPPTSTTEGVHSREALDLVKEHVLAVLGPASVAVAQTQIKMSKLQAAQVGGRLARGWRV